jgi:hypothetical protein
MQHETAPCEVCSQIPVKELFSRCLPVYKNGSRSWSDDPKVSIDLGTLLRVSKNEHCQFCVLVLRTLNLHPSTSLLNIQAIEAANNTVTLTWEFSPVQYVGFRVRDSLGRSGFLLPLETRSPMLEYEFLSSDYAGMSVPARTLLQQVVGWDGKFISTHGTLRNLYGRELHGGQMNFDVVASWYLDCEIRHPRCCRSNFSTPASREEFEPMEIMLLDVRKNCLVSARSSARYVALSYVWGNAENIKTLIANKDLFAQAGYLSKPTINIPRTIRDAMELTRKLEEQYLWVDSLCIVQDSAEKYTQIRQMDRIYSHALLTIVALSAENANEGLSGVRPVSRASFQNIATLQGVKWANKLQDLDDAVKGSSYTTRGWTYQELLFSTRCLVIGKQQAYWHCNSDRWDEDQIAPVFGGSLFGTVKGMRGMNLTQMFGVYERTVEEYTRRCLRYDDDILNAFSGIASAMGRYCKDELVAGLPLRRICRALLWMSPDRPAVRRQLSGLISTKNFPSWSWIGWRGGVTYELTQMWHARDVYAMKNLMSDIEVCSPTVSFPVVTDTAKDSIHEGRCFFDTSSRSSMLNSMRTTPSIMSRHRNQSTALSLDFPLLLKFRAPSVPLHRFRLGDIKIKRYREFESTERFLQLCVLDESNVQCGALFSPEFAFDASDASLQLRLIGMSYSYRSPG